MAALRWVAKLADELYVTGRVDQFELLYGGWSRGHEMAVFDEAGLANQIHREPDPPGLQGMLIRKVVLHQIVAVNEHHRTRHGHLP